MTTVLIATQPDEVRNLLGWSRAIAKSRDEELVVLLPQRKKGESRLVEVCKEAEDRESELLSTARSLVHESSSKPSVSDESTDADRSVAPTFDAAASESDRDDSPVKLLQLLGENWQSALIGELRNLKPSLLVVPAHTISKDGQEEDWQASLLGFSDCELLLLQDDAVTFEDKIRVAVFLSHDTDNETSLKFAVNLSAASDGIVTALYVAQNIGEYSDTVGRRQLDELLRRTVRRADLDMFRRKVVVAAHPAEAFSQIHATDYDMLLLGTSSHREMRRFIGSSPVDQASESIPAVAVIRRGDSFGSRIWNRLDNSLRSFVPQLSREDRVSLVSRIQTSSQWDFDFVLLISLATLIACLGLAENSGAVIVGAMLVAPLMTPIAGVGLGVAHANSFLTRVALRTALRGFATAVAIGVLFGLSVQFFAWLGWLSPLQTGADLAFPSEMEGRMRPQFYDLLIALASGVAAAYAMGRPNLFSALPGVAIAAALVPPIATSGVAFSHGEFFKGGGAMLLFVTNMVTIILGTSLVFRAVGVRSQKEGPNVATWPRYALLLLVLLSVLVTIIIEVHRRSQN